eukprot:scaffold218908_cov33-Tisochrysis_lutea.AAC.1
MSVSSGSCGSRCGEVASGTSCTRDEERCAGVVGGLLAAGVGAGCGEAGMSGSCWADLPAFLRRLNLKPPSISTEPGGLEDRLSAERAGDFAAGELAAASTPLRRVRGGSLAGSTNETDLRRVDATILT